MQDLWDTWDVPVPESFGQRWLLFVKKLLEIKRYKISRWIRYRKSTYLQLCETVRRIRKISPQIDRLPQDVHFDVSYVKIEPRVQELRKNGEFTRRIYTNSPQIDRLRQYEHFDVSYVNIEPRLLELCKYGENGKIMPKLYEYAA